MAFGAASVDVLGVPPDAFGPEDFLLDGLLKSSHPAIELAPLSLALA